MSHRRWPWLAAAALASVPCLFLVFVLLVAVPFDEVGEGPKPTTRAIVAALILLSGSTAAGLARRGLRGAADPVDS